MSGPRYSQPAECGNGFCECTTDGAWGSETCCFPGDTWCYPFNVVNPQNGTGPENQARAARES